MTQNEKLLSFLSSGKTINAAQARGLFGIENVAARVSELREAGHCIYSNTDDNGVAQYRLGRPTKRMVAIAYRLFGAQVFN